MPNPYDQVPLGRQNDQMNAPDNNINYSDMTRFQLVSQYQQYVTDYPRSSSSYARMLSQPRFQYGTNGQDTRFYERQQQMNNMSYGAGIAKTGMDLGSYSLTSWATSRAMTSLGTQAALRASMGMIGGGIAGFTIGTVAPMAVTAAPLYFINKGVERTLERQRAMQSISADVEQYRERLGMSNLSSSQASTLGSNLTSSMYARGQFFDPVKQQEILKYGLANDMLSGKRAGMVTGDIKTFEKNFNELLKTVTEVSKTMKVTAQGAMAVVKEMQQSGFGTMGQIGTSVISAKAFGSMTGIGAQNMLSIGAAGAQAAQGTPYWSTAGSAMYMGGAAMAGYMARGNDPRTAKSVQMAGGVAQAGGIIAQTQMNIMQSGMGARMIASVMNQQGKIDPAALQNLLQGNQSGHDIVTRASQIAHGWGSGGRVMFARNRSEAANQIAEDPVMAARFAMANFNAWGSNKRGTREEQAQAFAQTFVQGGQREQNLYADWLLSNKGFGQMNAEQDVARAVANEPGPLEGFISKGWRKFSNTGWRGGLVRAGETAAEAGSQAVNDITQGWAGFKRKTANITMDFLENLGGGIAPYGMFNRGRLGTVESGYKNLLGLNNVNITKADLKELSGLTGAQRAAGGLITNTENTMGWQLNIAGKSNLQLNTLFTDMRTAIGNGTTAQLFRQSDFLESAGITKDSAIYKTIMKDPTRAQQLVFNMLGSASATATTEMKNAVKATTNLNKFIESNPEKESEIKRISERFNNLSLQEINRLDIGPTVGPASIKQQTNALLKQNLNAQRTLRTLNGVDISGIGDFASANSVLKRVNADALSAMGLGPGMMPRINASNAGLGLATGLGVSALAAGVGAALGTFILPGVGTAAGWAAGAALAGGMTGGYLGTGYFAKKGIRNAVGRISGIGDIKGREAEAMAAIAQKMALGEFNIRGDEGDDIKSELIKKQKDVIRTFGLRDTGKWSDAWDDWTTRFGDKAKDWANAARNSQQLQQVTGANNATMRFLKSINTDASTLKDVADYLDPAKAGVLQGSAPSTSVAAALGQALGGIGAAEVQKLAKSGQLAERVYSANKTDIGQISRIKMITDELQRLQEHRDKGNAFYRDENGKERAVSSIEKAEDYYMKKMSIEQAIQKGKETTTGEAAQGKSLGGVVAAPILNYWNNKWSM